MLNGGKLHNNGSFQRCALSPSGRRDTRRLTAFYYRPLQFLSLPPVNVILNSYIRAIRKHCYYSRNTGLPPVPQHAGFGVGEVGPRPPA